MLVHADGHLPQNPEKHVGGGAVFRRPPRGFSARLNLWHRKGVSPGEFPCPQGCSGFPRDRASPEDVTRKGPGQQPLTCAVLLGGQDQASLHALTSSRNAIPGLAWPAGGLSAGSCRLARSPARALVPCCPGPAGSLASPRAASLPPAAVRNVTALSDWTCELREERALALIPGVAQHPPPGPAGSGPP